MPGQLCNVCRIPRLRNRNSLIELKDLRFAMVADRTFESSPIVPRPLRIYARKHHAGAAFRTARLHGRACRDGYSPFVLSSIASGTTTEVAGTRLAGDPPHICSAKANSELFCFPRNYILHLFLRPRRATVRRFYCTAVSNFAQTRPSLGDLLPDGRLLLRSRRYIDSSGVISGRQQSGQRAFVQRDHRLVSGSAIWIPRHF
jgi:hypothetical protein